MFLMSAPGHAKKTFLQRAPEPSDNAPKTPEVFQRICVRCHRPINGYGFRTPYGHVLVRMGPELPGQPHYVKVPVCGDPVHIDCDLAVEKRAIPHDPSVLGESEYARTHRNVAPGITLNEETGRYSAQWKKKRLGSHPTIEQAQAAIDKHRSKQKKKTGKRKTKKEDQ